MYPNYVVLTKFLLLNSKMWTFYVCLLQLTIWSNTLATGMCRHRLNKREAEQTLKNNMKPCCLPETWKARFLVRSVLGGKHRSRVDYGAFRMRRSSDGSIENALLVVGKTVASPEFCHLNTSHQSTITEALCPRDRVSCLHSPFLGEPRCLTEANGYKLQKSKQLSVNGKVRQMWFTDRINRLHGLIERHIYHVVRQYGICGLVRYQIQWGNYVIPWRSCRMFVKMEQTYVPVSGSFKQKFTHHITDNLLFC